MLIAQITEKMIGFYQGNIHDISHFLKVHTFARTIGQLEQLDDQTMKILEISAVVHDIACPLCRKKYGNADGKKQELESPALLQPFLEEFRLPTDMLQRVIYLVSHHHTYTDVDGLDYQILLEADFLVNADEGEAGHEAVKRMREQVFRTASGKRLLDSIYGQTSREI